MLSKVYLATYHIRVTNKTSDDQILSRFNGSTDLFDVIADFFEDLFINQRKEKNDEEKDTTIHFTLKSRPKIDRNKRIIYGFIDSGLSGDSSTIKDINNNEDLFEIDPDKHGAFKELFFFCKLPKESKKGFMILQKRASHGVKGAVSRMLKRWLKDQGYMDNYFWLNNVVNGEVFNKMIEEGNLKKVELIYNYAPATLDDLFANGANKEIATTKGKLKTVVSSGTSLGQEWKDVARSLFYRKGRNTVVETAHGTKEFDELEFELEFKGKKKTFYARSRNRTLPDIDVTEDIIFLNRKPTDSSLLKKCEELLIDVYNYREDV